VKIIDLVKWDAPNYADDIYAWRFPENELSTWTQLIVSESQEAVLLLGGQMDGPFTAGRHTLTTQNIPIISKLVGIPFNGKSPFTAEVWFVNKAIPLDVKWGTTDPIQLQDPKYGIMLPVRAFGQLGVQIDHTKKFLMKLVGVMHVFDREKLVSYFRGVILTRVKDMIGKMISQQGISILEISAHLNDISERLKEQLSVELSDFGLRLISFYVNSINTPEDDPAVEKLKASLAKRAEMNILGFNYQQERTFDTLQTAAGNEGGGSVMNSAMGLGMGVGIGVPMGQAVGHLASQINPNLIACPKCGHKISSNDTFCGNCGFLVQEPAQELVACSKCAAKAPKSAKFCPSCGNPMQIKCSGCQEELVPNAKFCPNCGLQQG